MKKAPLLEGIRVEPQYRERVWGGHSLRPDADTPIGEAWIVYEENKVTSGPAQGRTLGEIAGGITASLLSRAADVTLKERRRMVLMVPDSKLYSTISGSVAIVPWVVCMLAVDMRPAY